MTQIAIYTHQQSKDYVAIECNVLDHQENMRRILVRLKARLKQCIRLNNDTDRARKLEIQINKWESAFKEGKLTDFTCLLGTCPDNIKPLSFVRSIAVTGFKHINGWIERSAGHLGKVVEMSLEDFTVRSAGTEPTEARVFAIGIPGNAYRYHYFNENPGAERDRERLIDNAIFAFGNYITKVSRTGDVDEDVFESEKRSNFKKEKLREVLLELRRLRKSDCSRIVLNKIACDKGVRRVRASEYNSRSMRQLMESFSDVTPMTEATASMTSVVSLWVKSK